MKSQLFYTDQYVTVQDQIKGFLNGQDQFLSGSTAKSTRAVGDANQDILSENFQSILGTERCARTVRSASSTHTRNDRVDGASSAAYSHRRGNRLEAL